ncbi:DUF2179 domain-containing protein [Crassaminicella thermophila]|uniref:DUF2179 domain-containing protein n=1 Tax=Crassaminicella thermophila TaxID=2599308 RepID=A0A5C0SCA0_CRATE|nr:DUF5698 domain-containing protein [Crassaminicella thermophila]QEK11552.1 DUF2179 domain-containing protein [Crassaminicella thermophila]
MEKGIIILVLQLVYVPVLTLRTIFMVRNKCKISAVFGFLESAIYIFGLALVLKGEKNIYSMVIYALGFGLGICLGGFIENKIGIGNVAITVNMKNKNESLITQLREMGFHITIFEGMGVDGKRYQFDILTSRHKEEELLELIKAYEPNAFIISFEPRKYKERTSLRLK